MTFVDWTLIGILALSLMIGVWRGLVYEVLSVFVWIAAFVLAQWFAPEVAAKLPMQLVLCWFLLVQRLWLACSYS
jgi:membrane protein required for colicin V production